MGIEPYVNLKLVAEDESTYGNMQVSDFEKLFDDLWVGYLFLQHGHRYDPDAFNMRKSGIRLDMCFYHLFTSVKKLFDGDPWQIIQDADRYYFARYRTDVRWANQWSALEVKPFLNACSPALRELFLLWLRAFAGQVGAGFWFDGYFDHVEDHLERADENYEGEDDIAAAHACLALYNEGEPHELAKMMWRQPFTPVAVLEKRLRRFDPKHPTVKLMKGGLELMKEGLSMELYRPDHEVERVDWEFYGVNLDMQVSIVYELDDMYTTEIESYLDAFSQEGVASPVLPLPIDPWGEDGISEAQIQRRIDWPNELQWYFSNSHKLAKEAIKYGTDRKIRRRIQTRNRDRGVRKRRK